MRHFIGTIIFIVFCLNSSSSQEVTECIIKYNYQSLYDELKIMKEDTSKRLSPSSISVLDSLIDIELLISQRNNGIRYKNANKISTLGQPNKGILPTSYSIKKDYILLNCRELLNYSSGNPIWTNETVEFIIDSQTDFFIHKLDCWRERIETVRSQIEKDTKKEVQNQSSNKKNTESTLDKGNSYSYRTYYRGARGGCYYINSRGNKVYVDRNLCD